jgi:hypothetical protein
MRYRVAHHYDPYRREINGPRRQFGHFKSRHAGSFSLATFSMVGAYLSPRRRIACVVCHLYFTADLRRGAKGVQAAFVPVLPIAKLLADPRYSQRMMANASFPTRLVFLF